MEKRLLKAKVRGSVLFVATTIVFVFISVFCIAGTVFSQSDIANGEMEEYYRAVEKELLSQTKNQLKELGYENSGVTLTRVVDEEGNREYTFTIHHGGIDKMSEEGRVELAEILARRAEEKLLHIENATLCHEFLMYD